jgi:hypothetical protein
MRYVGLVAIVLACACSKSTEPKAGPTGPTDTPPTRAEPAPIENTDPAAPEAPVDAPQCVTAIEIAMKHEGQGAAAEWFELADEQPDLDGDGRTDIVLVGNGYRNAEHYFFVLRDGCADLVGVMSASTMMGFYCGTERTNGLCDIGIGRMMVHGETERSTYKFNGTTYEMYGTPELGPRKEKFK